VTDADRTDRVEHKKVLIRKMVQGVVTVLW